MISIIIPTFNEAENLRRVLDQLSSQSPPPQIIIADGGSSDATLAIAAE
ncbi:MAG: glycosyltransferase, partial [Rhodospirillaceae bacterium]|nr:glycosyltransferase [Rhodospirillaceae bacterium]